MESGEKLEERAEIVQLCRQHIEEIKRLERRTRGVGEVFIQGKIWYLNWMLI